MTPTPIAKLQTVFDRMNLMLSTALRAANKLNTMYLRHEVEPRAEIDALIGIRDDIYQWRKEYPAIRDELMQSFEDDKKTQPDLNQIAKNFDEFGGAN